MALRLTRRTGAPRTGTQRTGAGGRPGRSWRVQAVTLARQHWLLGTLLVLGLVLRVLVLLAYRPALVYVDSLKYLYGASPGSEPFGYTVVLKSILVVGDLGTVAAIQHLLGLAMAVVLYAVLRRRGVARWLSALAVAPVLADAYQLQMEQMVMPDVWFEALIVAGLAVLLWQPEVTVRRAAAAGAVLAVAATVKQLGEVLVVPAACYLVVAGVSWREGLRRAAALAMAFVLVVLCYLGLSFVRDGHFRLANQQALTGRLAAAADCATLRLPAGVRPLCPTPAQQRALGPDSLEHNFRLSPLYATPVTPGTRGRLIAELKSAIEHQQPMRVVVSVLSDSLRLFALTRQPSTWVTPISRWQFQAGYPTYPPWTNICAAGNPSPTACLADQRTLAQRVTPVSDQLVRPGGRLVVGVQRALGGDFAAHALRPSYGGPVEVDRSLAAFLRSYQLGGGYTPGPLLALLALAALAGSVLALARRHAEEAERGLTLACLLCTLFAAVLLLAPDLYEFSWRYELPAVVTLVPAGVFGCVALTRIGLLRAGRSRAQ